MMRSIDSPPPPPTSRAGPSMGNRATSSGDAIRSTDDDALMSKLSAVNLGYLKDPYASSMTRKKPTAMDRRPPLINVGTHHRTWSMDKLVEEFLKPSPGSEGKGKGRQIVSLGAGSDTRFWRLKDNPLSTNLVKYIEIDFHSVTAQKIGRIVNSKALCERVFNGPFVRSSLTGGGTGLSSELYAIVAIDLSTMPAIDDTSISNPLNSTLLPMLDPEIPTLFIAECLFCYMTPEESRRVIDWFGKVFEDCMGVVYEMCGLDDSFGTVMKRNLLSRGIPLPGAIFDSPSSQASRFLSSGFPTISGISLKDIRKTCIPKTEIDRLSGLEMLDEVEELELVLEHYCVAWGVKGDKIGEISLRNV